jgi:hypothetical protein
MRKFSSVLEEVLRNHGFLLPSWCTGCGSSKFMLFLQNKTPEQLTTLKVEAFKEIKKFVKTMDDETFSKLYEKAVDYYSVMFNESMSARKKIGR